MFFHNNNSDTMTKKSILIACLAAPLAQAQVPADSHWFYDETDHRGEGFAMLSTETHMYMGGLFISAGGNVNEEDLSRYNYATESWENVPGLDVPSTNNDIGGRVDEIYQDRNGFIFFGGNLAFSGDTEARRIVRFDPATNTWEALFDPSSNLTVSTWDNGPVNGRVLAITSDDDYVYVGGNFSTASAPDNERFILRYALGAGNSVSTGRWEAMGTGTSDQVDDLLLLPNGDLIAATRSTDGLKRWDGTSWSTYAGGVDNGGTGVIRTMARHPDGRIFMGGSFTTVGASNLPVNYVAAYNPANNTWDDLDDGFDDQYIISNGASTADGVFDLEIDSQGRVYVGGDFQTTTGGTRFDANHIAYWDDTGSWQSMGSGLGSTDTQIVNTLGIDPNGRVFAGGKFSRGWEVEKGDSNSMAIWDPVNELSVIPSSSQPAEVRIEDDMVVIYVRQDDAPSQFRVREKATLPLSSSDNEYGPFGYPRYGISRQELRSFNPAANPRLFYQVQFSNSPTN